MKKSNIFKLMAFAVLAITMTACNKYEEGSNFSFISKKSRVVNNWEVIKVEQMTGTVTADITSVTPATEVNIKDDNTYVTSTTYIILSNPVTTTTSGTWAFNDDKTSLLMTDDSTNEVQTATIIKLKKDEMKYSYVDGSSTYTVELATK